MIVRALDLLHNKILPAAVCKYTTCHGTRPKPSPLTTSILILSLLPYTSSNSKRTKPVNYNNSFHCNKALQYTGHNALNDTIFPMILKN